MHVSILNFSGNVGKSEIANQVFAPRMKGAKVILIESINSDGTSRQTVRGDQFGAIQEGILTLPDSISDVGASNVEDYMAGLEAYHGAHEDIDVFVVPTVPDTKQMSDTVSTIDALANDIGVPADKIRVVFNRVNPRHSVEAQFGPILDWHASSKAFTLNREAVIYTNEIYALIRGMGQSILDVANDKTDYRASMEDAAPAERARLARQISLQRLAVSVGAQHDRVFRLLTE
jgi:hypothetical protein